MPIHDWLRVDANLFHDFHQTWTVSICNTLKDGLLPKACAAPIEQHDAGVVSDFLALQRRGWHEDLAARGNRIAWVM